MKELSWISFGARSPSKNNFKVTFYDLSTVLQVHRRHYWRYICILDYFDLDNSYRMWIYFFALILNHLLLLGSVGFRSQFTTQTSISSLNTLTSQYSVYQIDEDQISLNKDRPLGEGNFGIVFKGMCIFSLN